MTLSVGDVRASPVNPTTQGLVRAGIGCLSHIAITVGNVENQAIVQNVHDSLIELTTGTIGRALLLGCLAFSRLPVQSTTVEVHAARHPPQRTSAPAARA